MIATKLPSVSFLSKCRSALAVATKLLDNYQLIQAPVLKDHHYYGTTHSQIDIQNSSACIESHTGNTNVCLYPTIIFEDRTLVLLDEAILHTFKEGRERSTVYRKVTVREYPNRDNLLDNIPKRAGLSPAKLAQSGWVMTNTSTPSVHFAVYLLLLFKNGGL